MVLAGLGLAAGLSTVALIKGPAAEAAVATGANAPSFAAVDTAGKTRSLAEFAGKTVVLEWTNHDCPFVVKHYASGNMQALQKAAAADNVVWLTVISSAPGKQGYVAPARADELTKTRAAAPTAVLLDPKGDMGRAFDAKTTPHMFVINAQGVVVYQGAIDDKPSPDKATLAGATNYLTAALADVKAGRTVATATTKPYGCSVKY
jgi:peroxiredoxin